MPDDFEIEITPQKLEDLGKLLDEKYRLICESMTTEDRWILRWALMNALKDKSNAKVLIKGWLYTVESVIAERAKIH